MNERAGSEQSLALIGSESVVNRHLDESLHRATFKKITRRCTDVLFLLIFVAFTAATGYLSGTVTQKVNMNYLHYGMDSQGNFCGFSPGYESYPIAYYAKIDVQNRFPYAVCIKDCPS